MLKKIGSMSIHFGIVDADYNKRIISKDTLGGGKVAFQLSNGSGTDYHRFNVEFFSEFLLPLIT